MSEVPDGGTSCAGNNCIVGCSCASGWEATSAASTSGYITVTTNFKTKYVNGTQQTNAQQTRCRKKAPSECSNYFCGVAVEGFNQKGNSEGEQFLWGTNVKDSNSCPDGTTQGYNYFNKNFPGSICKDATSASNCYLAVNNESACQTAPTYEYYVDTEKETEIDDDYIANFLTVKLSKKDSSAPDIFIGFYGQMSVDYYEDGSSNYDDLELEEANDLIYGMYIDKGVANDASFWDNQYANGSPMSCDRINEYVVYLGGNDTNVNGLVLGRIRTPLFQNCSRAAQSAQFTWGGVTYKFTPRVNGTVDDTRCPDDSYEDKPSEDYFKFTTTTTSNGKTCYKLIKDPINPCVWQKDPDRDEGVQKEVYYHGQTCYTPIDIYFDFYVNYYRMGTFNSVSGNTYVDGNGVVKTNYYPLTQEYVVGCRFIDPNISTLENQYRNIQVKIGDVFTYCEEGGSRLTTGLYASTSTDPAYSIVFYENGGIYADKVNMINAMESGNFVIYRNVKGGAKTYYPDSKGYARVNDFARARAGELLVDERSIDGNPGCPNGYTGNPKGKAYNDYGTFIYPDKLLCFNKTNTDTCLRGLCKRGDVSYGFNLYTKTSDGGNNNCVRVSGCADGYGTTDFRGYPYYSTSLTQYKSGYCYYPYGDYQDPYELTCTEKPKDTIKVSLYEERNGSDVANATPGSVVKASCTLTSSSGNGGSSVRIRVNVGRDTTRRTSQNYGTQPDCSGVYSDTTITCDGNKHTVDCSQWRLGSTTSISLCDGSDCYNVSEEYGKNGGYAYKSGNVYNVSISNSTSTW